MKRTICLLILICVAISSLSPIDVDNLELRIQLNEIYTLAADTTNSKELIESKYLDLLKKTNILEEKGLIYFFMARTLRKVPNKPYKKIIEYSKSALQYPLDIETKAFTYVILTEALSKDSYNKGLMIEDRKEIAEICLNGLKLLKMENLPKEIQDLPGVSMLTIAGPKDDPEIQKKFKIHEQQVEERKRIEQQNTLIMYRKSLIGKCISIYSYKPYDNEEFRETAMEYLNDEEYVNEIMEKLNNKIIRKEAVRKRFEKDE